MAGAPSDLIKRVPLFSELDEREVKSVAESMVERTFQAGAAVTTEGKGGTGSSSSSTGQRPSASAEARWASSVPATTSARWLSWQT